MLQGVFSFAKETHITRAREIMTMCCCALQSIAVCSSMLQCVAVCCSLLQCGAVCCSVFLFAQESYTARAREVIACACACACMCVPMYRVAKTRRMP